MNEIVIPTLNSNDPEYDLVEWCVADGEPVTAGQPLLVLETSKAAEEVLATATGVLQQVAPAGSRCGPGTVIGRVLEDGAAPPPRAGERPPASTELQPGEPVLTAPARAIVAEHQISADRLRGLGKRLIREADVLGLLDAATQTVPLPDLQRAVAAAVTATVLVPAAYTVMKIYTRETDASTGIPERIIRATAAQRGTFPAFFARLGDDMTLILAPGAHIGVTVDVGHGLYLPVLQNAERMSDQEISAALLRFRVKARKARFKSADLAGANIAVTLHTESAVVLAQPILYPGHTCALAVSSTLQELHGSPDGTLCPSTYINLGLAYDHRVINGRDAVLFLDAIKRHVEQEYDSP